MANLASRREILLRVVRVVRPVVVIQVARNARRIRKVVVVVDVAVRALSRRDCVRTGEREPGLRVIVIRRLPCARRVAHLACRREVLLHVVGIRRPVVVLLVAGHARGIGDVVVVVDVAIHALARRHRMQAGQREAGLRVIEVGRGPATGRVARFAGLGKSQLHVVGIRRPVVILLVTRNTGRDRQVVVVVDVAIYALPRWNRVHAGQGEAGAGMVKLGIQPVVETVALLAGR